MRTFFAFVTILNGVIALAQQAPSFQTQQRTSGVVGITHGQTARWNVLSPTVPAPLLQILCSATLGIADDQGKILKSSEIAQLTGGRSVSLDLNADVDLTSSTRTQIHGLSIAPMGCRLLGTLEIIDNSTQRTVVVVGSEPTYPVTPPLAVIAESAKPMGRQ